MRDHNDEKIYIIKESNFNSKEHVTRAPCTKFFNSNSKYNGKF